MGMFTQPIAQVPAEHQRGADQVERVQQPDRPRRQAIHVDRVHHVAEVGQRDITQAIRRQVTRSVGLYQHRQRAGREDHRGGEPGERRKTEHCHGRTLGTRPQPSHRRYTHSGRVPYGGMPHLASDTTARAAGRSAIDGQPGQPGPPCGLAGCPRQ